MTPEHSPTRSDQGNNNTNLAEQLADLRAKYETLLSKVPSASCEQKLSSTMETIEDRGEKKPEIFKVSTKVPPFYVAKPELWFMQVEAQFRNNGIKNDQTKYDIVISSLDPTYLDVIADVMRNPPDSGKYEKLKEVLAREYAHSQEERLKKILHGIELGDRKPSVLLREMREVSKGMLNDDVLESLWSSKLPQTMRAVIAPLQVSITQKAESADKIADIASFQTSAIVQKITEPRNEIHELKAQIEALTQKFDQISQKFDNSRSRSRSQKRSGNNKKRNSSPSPNVKKEYDQCWYHFKFGNEAKKCTNWCKFNKEKKN